MPGVDIVADAVVAIRRRIDELRPRYEEYLRLDVVLQALVFAGERVAEAIRGRQSEAIGSKERREVTAARPAAKRQATAARRSSASSGRTRADETVDAIGGNPGIKIAEIAERIGVRPNYLYRVTAKLERDGVIRKKGTGFYLAG